MAVSCKYLYMDSEEQRVYRLYNEFIDPLVNDRLMTIYKYEYLGRYTQYELEKHYNLFNNVHYLVNALSEARKQFFEQAKNGCCISQEDLDKTFDAILVCYKTKLCKDLLYADIYAIVVKTLRITNLTELGTAILNPRIVDRTPTSFRLVWNPVTGASNYLAKLYLSNGNILVTQINTNTTSYLFTGLNPGVVYKITLEPIITGTVCKYYPIDVLVTTAALTITVRVFGTGTSPQVGITTVAAGSNFTISFAGNTNLDVVYSLLDNATTIAPTTITQSYVFLPNTGTLDLINITVPHVIDIYFDDYTWAITPTSTTYCVTIP